MNKKDQILLEQAYEDMPSEPNTRESSARSTSVYRAGHAERSSDEQFEEIVAELRSVRRMIQHFGVELRPAQRDELLNAVGAIDEEIDDLLRQYQSQQD